MQRRAELLVVVAAGGADRDRDDGGRELDHLQDDRRGGIAERIAGARLAEAGHGDDVAGVGGLQRDLLAGVHAEETPDAARHPQRGVEDHLAHLEGAGVDADIEDTPHVLVGHDLEGQGGKGILIAREAPRFGIAMRADRPDVQRRGQEARHAIKQRLDALVLEGGTAVDRNKIARQAALADALEDVGVIQCAFVKVLLQQVVVLLGGALDELLVGRVADLAQILGDISVVQIDAAALLIKGDGLHAQDVHHAREGLARADGVGHDDRVRLQRVADLLDRAVEVRADAVHLVDEAELRHHVLLALAPDLLGLGLDAAHGAEERDGAVEHAQAALDLGCEVDVAGSIDQTDLVILPVYGGGGRADRDAALLLLHHEVHGGGAIMHLAKLVVGATVEQDTLAGRGFAGINVGHDADIADLAQGWDWSDMFVLKAMRGK